MLVPYYRITPPKSKEAKIKLIVNVKKKTQTAKIHKMELD